MPMWEKRNVKDQFFPLLVHNINHINLRPVYLYVVLLDGNSIKRHKRHAENFLELLELRIVYCMLCSLITARSYAFIYEIGTVGYE